MSNLQRFGIFLVLSLLFIIFISKPTQPTTIDFETKTKTLLSQKNFQHFDLADVDIYATTSNPEGPITILVPGYKSSLAIWSKKIAKDNFEMGSMFVYVDGLLSKDHTVVILQPKLEDFSYFSNSIAFLRHKYPHRKFNIIAHSRGGLYFFQWLELLNDFSFLNNIDKCFLLDSIHETEPSKFKTWLRDHVINWTTSKKNIGQILSFDDISHSLFDFDSFDSFITWKSGGNYIHELIPYYSLSDVLSYF